MGQAVIARRHFLGWCGGWAAAVGSGGGVVGLVSCGGSGSPASAGAPFADIGTVQQPTTVSISIQPRKVEWMVGKLPSEANAWVYAVDGVTPASGSLANHLGATIVVRRHVPCTITWTNMVGAAPGAATMLASPPINVPPLFALCGNVQIQSPVGLATHLHGARVQGDSDGWPLAPIGYAGNPYGFPTTRRFVYPNDQRSTMLWYHDHAMDRTGPHVHAGLAGLYFIRDAADDAILNLVGGAARELPCVIQDRVLTADLTGIDYAAGRPDTDELFRPEFLGTTLFVNGHPSPAIQLTRDAWRLRVLNGSNARTYALALCDPDALAARSGTLWYSQCLRIIGADGGLVGASVPLGATDVLLAASAQRRDVIVDLGAVPASVKRLRLVNLSLAYLLETDAHTPEAIYTTFDDTVLAPSSPQYTSDDAALYRALASPLAQVMAIELAPSAAAGASQPAAPIDGAKVDAILAAAASDDDYVWDGQALGPRAGAAFGPNRLILLVSNTEERDVDQAINGIDGWSDVQIFEMDAGGDDWSVPFAVDLVTATNPPAAEPTTLQQGYRLARRSFFARQTNPDITVAKAYPQLHAPTIRAKAGTYERWYVANIGNSQPLNTAAGDPDMHPFHVHLVNFVVTRRWQLDDGPVGGFVPVPNSALNLDAIARQDTVLIPSGQLVELLVYYPAGYSGNFVYHCHILEHEDMCMMSHFEVSSAG